jgi:thioredoxin 1
MASANLKEFTVDNWQTEVLDSDQPVLVDFWAPWCGPCRMLSPIIDKLAEQFAGKVKVGKLNTDNNQDVAVRYGISGIPQVLFFAGKGGGDQPKDRLVGFQSEAELTKAVNRVLGV